MQFDRQPSMSSREQASPDGCVVRVVVVVPVPVVVVAVVVVVVSIVVVGTVVVVVVVADVQARHTRAATRRKRCLLRVQLAAPQLVLASSASSLRHLRSSWSRTLSQNRTHLSLMAQRPGFTGRQPGFCADVTQVSKRSSAAAAHSL
jgi:hypothetical protein